MKSVIVHIRKAQRLVLAVALFAAIGLVTTNAAIALDSPNQPEIAPSLTQVEGAAPANVEPATGEHGAAEETAATHGDDASKGGLPQLDFTTYAPQIFWMAIIFLVLYLVMAKKALPDIGSIVEGRRNLIDTNLKSAEDARTQADNIRLSYEKNIEEARAKAVQAVQEVEMAAKKHAADQADAFRKKAEDAVSQTEARVLAQKDVAMGEMKNVAAELASVAAEKITGVGTDVQKAKAIVDSIAGKAKAA